MDAIEKFKQLVGETLDEEVVRGRLRQPVGGVPHDGQLRHDEARLVGKLTRVQRLRLDGWVSTKVPDGPDTDEDSITDEECDVMDSWKPKEEP